MTIEKAFVVMQVGESESPERKRADEVYDFIIRPALEARGLDAYRADLDPSPGGVTAKMLSELLSARLVIADLTGRNPNVFYELGITHSFARAVICIVDSVSALPFDTKDQRVIELGAYAESGLTYTQGEAAKASLAKSLDVVLADGYEAPSPVREVAGSQSLDRLAPENPVASELASMRETLDELRLLLVERGARADAAQLETDFKALRSTVERWLGMGVVVVGIDDTGFDGAVSSDLVRWYEGAVRRAARERAKRDPWEAAQERAKRDPWEAAQREDPPL